MKIRIASFRDKTGWEGIQKLQRKRWYGWETIDKEVIPRHVIVSQGCFGDTGGWKSKWADYWIGHTGKFGEPIEVKSL